METQDTENDCSSRASSFTYQTPDFREKQFDENWEWSKQSSFKPFKKDSYPRLAHLKHGQSLDENDRSSSYSDFDDTIRSSVYKINETSKSEFLQDMTSPMGVLKPWNNRSYLNDENQLEIISDISPNIVVPTVRKIFSPVFLEENGETSFIEVVINEDVQKIEEIIASAATSEIELHKSENNFNAQIMHKTSQEQLENVNQDENISKKIIESHSPHDLNNQETDQQNKGSNYEKFNNYDEDLNLSNLHENFNTENENEGVTKNVEEKSYFDIGFPPISPIRGRREFKSPKETSSLKRMIAARQNKKMYEFDLNEARALRSNSSSPDSKCTSEKNSDIKMETEKKIFNNSGREFYKSVSSSHMKVNSSDRCQQDKQSFQLPSKIVLKSSSTGALRLTDDFDYMQKNEKAQRKSAICESISLLEERNKLSDQPLSTPESLRLRALKIQKAKEDFFNAQLQQIEPKIEVKIEWKQASDIKELNLEREEKSILIKSASEGTVSMNEESQQANEETTLKKSKFSGITSKLNVVLRRSGTTSADSSLRRSVAIPPSHQVDAEGEQEPTRSCPSSPILLRDEPTWWPLNPAKMIFRPKGKYKFNHK